MNKWFLLYDYIHPVGHGILIRKSKEPMEFPETYKLLPPESKIAGYGELVFVNCDDTENPIMQYDVFISAKPRMYQTMGVWLYKDLTAYYQSKYPEANVKAVAIRYTTKIGS